MTTDPRFPLELLGKKAGELSAPVAHKGGYALYAVGERQVGTVPAEAELRPILQERLRSMQRAQSPEAVLREKVRETLKLEPALQKLVK